MQSVVSFSLNHSDSVVQCHIMVIFNFIWKNYKEMERLKEVSHLLVYTKMAALPKLGWFKARSQELGVRR